MTRRNFYKTVIWIPLLFPIIVLFPFGFNMQSPANGVEFLSAVFANFLLWSFIFGGLPYCIFAVALLFWSRGKTNDALKRIMYFLPLLFLPIFLGSMLLMEVIWFHAVEGSYLYLIGAVTIVILGYLYVFFVHWLEKVLLASKILQN